MPVGLHVLVDFIVYLVSLAAIYILRRWNSTQRPGPVRQRVRTVLSIAVVWLTIGMALSPAVLSRHLPNYWVSWFRAGAIAIAAWALAAVFIAGFWKSLPRFDPQRRRFLGVARAATFAAPVLVTGFAIIKREELTLRQVDIPIPNLPKDLQGLRIVQISDIHLGPFVSEAMLARAIDMANETRAHIALVTGDLITSVGDPLDTCMRQLSRLKANAPILGCLGNHEVYAGCERYTTEQGARIGIRFLRHESQILRFGGSRINFAGVDYQRIGKEYLVGAEDLLVPDTLNIMLSHNPDVFPVAARKGYNLTLSGHTHGGQVNVEILHQGLNIARFFTPYIDGLYRKENASVFVTRGIGTVGLPARLGAPPEIALLRLCAT